MGAASILAAVPADPRGGWALAYRSPVRVAGLTRFPVKSMGGQALDAAAVDPDGLAGDRRWSLVDAVTGAVLTGRCDPGLLFAAAAVGDDGSLRVTLPDGSVAGDDGSLSAWVGRPVRLVRAPDGSPAHDTAGFRVSLVGRPEIAGWAECRFRTNVLLDGDPDVPLRGTVGLGPVVLRVREPIGRCVMVTRPQPGGVERDPTVLRRIHRERGGVLAVGATVLRSGTVRVGDEVRALAD